MDGWTVMDAVNINIDISMNMNIPRAVIVSLVGEQGHRSQTCGARLFRKREARRWLIFS